jgi:2-C-methyl-D-erythritol 4-phosphate cytidylyltransferase
LVTIEEICNVVTDAKEHGAAVLGVPCKATIKESEDGEFVARTIPRSKLWEVHTPQVIKIETLLKGFEKVAKENLEVTDDVSVVEALGEPVKLTRGEYTNLKITTPEDMDVAEAILEDRKSKPVNMLA